MAQPRQATDWLRSLERHVFPGIGSWPVSTDGVVAPGPPSLSSMVRVRVAAVSAGLTLVASSTMVSPSSSSASSTTVMVAVPAVSPSAMVMVLDDNL